MKKTSKKTISVILSVLMLLAYLPTMAFAETSGNYTYSLYSAGNAKITGVNTAISGDVTIPDTLDGHSITSIGNWAFNNCTSLTSITIPDSVTSIEYDAFDGCTSLTSIDVDANNSNFSSQDGILFNKSKTEIIKYPEGKSETNYVIPNNVTSIGDYAFSSCTSLTSITIPDSVTSIGKYAFYYCTSLTSITIPDSVTSIGKYAFYYCTSLTSVTIPDSVTSIGDYAFDSCKSLTSVTIPDSVTEIGYYAFDGCTSLTSIDVDANNSNFSSQDGILFNKSKTEIIKYPEGKSETNYVIPNNVTSIGDYAFSSCTSLTSIIIPDSVTEIGDNAFCDCESLTSITIPDSVTSIGYAAFGGCTSLTSITFPDIVTSIGYSAFKDCTSLTSITIPDSVTEIISHAFSGCTSLTSITIPDSVTSIGYSAFKDCTSLTSIAIPDSVTSIGCGSFENTGYYNNNDNWSNGVLYIGHHLIECKDDYSGDYEITVGTKSIADNAFDGCSSLTSITISDSVTSIGAYLFSGCTSLINMTLPDSITSTEWYAFYNCTSLTNITIPDGVTEIGDHAFEGCISLTSIDIDNNNSNYSSQNGILFNKEKTKIIKYPEGKSETNYIIPDGITEIGDSAFCGCTSLTSITIPDSVKSIEYCAFSGCTSLTSITIPDSVTEIRGSAFSDCTSLTSITIPDSVTAIGEYAFTNTGYFNNDDNWSNGVLYIGNHLIACKDDYSGEYEIKDGTKSISAYAFYGCTSLTSITIPDSIPSIEDYAFCDCTSLTSITIPDSVTSIGWYAFESCTSLTSITIPDSVTSIVSSAFDNTGYYNNDDNWSNGVLYIGNHFIKCRDDYSGGYAIKDGTKCIADWAFKYCTSLTSIIIPNGIPSIGWDTFYGCTSLISITIPDSVTSIGDRAFYDCDNLLDVYYGGTEEQWNSIAIEIDNEDLTSATIHFSDSQHEHTYGEWIVTTPATALNTGTETRTCSVCGNIETREIPKIKMTEEIKDENTGIAVQYKDDSFNSEIKLNVEQKIDGESYQIINKEKENFKYELFDITITSNGEKVQPSGSVLVKMPVPEGYNTNKLAVYYVTNSRTLEKMNSYYEDGYVYFEAAHFSDYVLVDESEANVTETTTVPDTKPITEEPTTELTFMLGDVNGDGKVTASDARLALRISAGLETATETQLLAADVDESKKITASDARTILRVSAELEKFKVK